MRAGGVGGGHTVTGLHFEKQSDLLNLIDKTKGYSIKDNSIYYNDLEVARSYKKRGFYKLLTELGVPDDRIPVKTLEPDHALYVMAHGKLFIIEIKFQQVAESVDEKLQTCDYKKKWYGKLLNPVGIDVEFIYVLSKWFDSDAYKEVLEYIKEVGCDYFFETLPLGRLGLPVAD